MINGKLKTSNIFKNFFNSLKLTKDFKLLCVYHLLIQVGQGMVNLFLPIFLYQKFGFSVYWVIVFFVALYFLSLLLIPIGAKFMNIFGVKKAMIIGRIFLILFYICFYFFDYNPILSIILSLVLMVAYKIVYWVPYHTTFIEFTDGKHRGRQLAWIRVLGYLGKIGSPLLAGMILTGAGFKLLFVVMIIIYLLSLIPLLGLTDVAASFNFTYLKTFKVLFDKKNRKKVYSFIADGSQKIVSVIIWPIFIFLLLDQEYSAVGAVTALIVVGTVILQMLMGFQTDKKSKKGLVKFGSSIYSIGWILKSFVHTSFQIFAIGTFHNFSLIALRTPFMSRVYNFLSRHETYKDEYTAVRNIALNIGRILMAGLLILAVYFFGLRAAFFLAAFASFLLNLF